MSKQLVLKVTKRAVIYTALLVVGIWAGTGAGHFWRSAQDQAAAETHHDAMQTYLQQNLKGISVGSEFPEVPLWSTDGSQAFLPRDLLPQGGLFFYVSSDCESCRDALKALKTAITSDRAPSTPVIVIAAGEALALADYIKSESMDVRLVVDVQHSLARDYGVVTFPCYFRLSETQIVQSYDAHATTVEQIRSALDEVGT